MRQGLYVVYDSKINTFSMPFFSQSDAGAQRTFADGCKQQGSLLASHPEDFALFRLCDVEDGDGMVTTLVAPHLVIQGRALIKES